MKKLVLILVLLIGISLFADGPGQVHWVSFEVKSSDGTSPSVTGDVDFDATLNGSSVDETTNMSNFIYTYNSPKGAVSLQVEAIDSNWDFGDELNVTVEYGTEKGTVSFILGSFASDAEEIPIENGGICLVPYDEEAVTDQTLETFLEEDSDNSCDITPSGSGNIGVGVPSSDFASLPGWSSSRGDDPNIIKCFSIQEVSGTFTSVNVNFSWTDATTMGTTNRVLLVSPDGINWIYSTNSASGISGDLTWATKGVSFTTTKFAHFAIGDGTNTPPVTTPNAPAGGSATLVGTTLTITCREVAVPGASYKVYTSDSFTGNWTDTGITITGTTTRTGVVTGVIDPTDVKYYAIRAYNSNETYLSSPGETLFTMVTSDFETNASHKYINLVRFPFSTMDSSCDSASELGNLITTTYCDAVASWDKTNQKYNYCVHVNGVWRGDFTLNSDGIYFVSVANGVNNLTRSKKLNKTAFSLKTGVNLIYVSPLDNTLTNASDLMGDIGTGSECTKVVQWNPANQTWSTYTGTETDFTLSEMQPVFVTVSTNVTYSK